MRAQLVRAIRESYLLCFLLLAVWLAVIGNRRAGSHTLPGMWALGSGVALGLALQSKLTATFSFVAIAGWVVATAVAPGIGRRRGACSAWRDGWLAGRGWLLALGVAVITFVISNPYLYPNPLLHTWRLFEDRRSTMAAQQAGNPAIAAGGLLERVSYVAGGSLVTPLRTQTDPVAVWRGLPIAMLVAPLGMLLLLIQTRSVWQHQRRLPVEGLVVVTTAVYLVGIAVTINVYWYRYLVPSYLFVSLLAGVGIATMVGWLRAHIRERTVIA